MNKSYVFIPKATKLIAVLLSLFMTFAFWSYVPQMKAEALTSADLSISDNGISFICAREGFHSTCYSDYSQSSIGYGTKCTGSSVQPHASGLHTITKESAMAALKTQVNSTYAPRVRKQTSGIIMNQNQFDALVSLCYNCGGGSTLISNSPLVKYLKGELSESQARSQYSNYIVKAGGNVLQGLINRRNAEADLFFSGSNSNLPTPSCTCNESYAGNYVVTTGGSNLNIRNGESTSETILGKIPNGTTVYVSKGNGSWLYVENYNGVSGHVSANYMTKIINSNWYDDLTPVDVGTDFYAYIININPWKHLTNNDGNVVISTEKATSDQIWRFSRNNNGSYRITNCNTGNCLDVYGALSDSGTNVQTWTANDSNAQQWYIYGSSGNYTFRASCTNCVLDVNGGLGDDGTNVQIWEKNDSSAQVFQIWKLMPELSVEVGNKTDLTNFTWSNLPGNERLYDLKIWRDALWKGDAYQIDWSLTGTSQEIGLPAGHYEAYIDIHLGTEMLMSNVVTFDITEDYFGKSELSVTSGDRYSKTKFNWTPIEKAEYYDLKIWNGMLWEDDAYQIEWNMIDTSIELALPAGYYEAYIDARTGDTIQMSNVVKFAVKRDYQLIKGDLNTDTILSMSDAVILQKYLLTLKTLTSEQLQIADINNDGRVNVLDLAMLKESLK